MIQNRVQGRTSHSRTTVMFVAQLVAMLVEVTVTLIVVGSVKIELKMKDRYFPAWFVTLMEPQIFDRHNTRWIPVKFGTVLV